MKPLLMLPALAVLSALAGCDEVSYANDPTNIANPAAEFCVAKGGAYDIRDDSAGNKVGFCVFPDGQEIDAWEYFRTHAT